MATIFGTTASDNLSGTADNDTVSSGMGNDFVNASAGNDSYNFGYKTSSQYWRSNFNDYDTLDYRNAWQSYGFASATDLKIVVDLQLGTVQKLNAAGTLLHTDTVKGLDAVFGTAGADIMRGRNAWDFDEFRGFGGNDTIDGRGGNDTSVYSNHASNGINVNLAAGTVNAGAEGGNDTLLQVEFITGTNFADTFNATGFGGSSTNRNSFGETYNGFSPLAGNDTIIGNGATILTFGGSLGGAIRVDLSALTAVGVSANVVVSFTDDPNSTAGFTPGTLSVSGISQVRGGNYNDTLLGGGSVNSDGGQVTVSGNTSFEGFRGFGGNDLINGRNGTDRAEYNIGNSSEGIVVNLAAGTVTGDPLFVGTDTLRGIESINSSFLDDVYNAAGFTLSNAAAASVNSGDVIVVVPAGETLASTAYNEFRAYAGDDIVTGNGATRVSFAPIHVENPTGTSVTATFTGAGAGSASYGDTDGHYGTVRFTGTFSVTGSTGNDALTGAVGFQNLRGYYGNDTLKGGAGNDQLHGHLGGAGTALNRSTTFTDNDSLDGGAGNDLLRGDFGNDTLLGGTGLDTLDGGTGNDSLTGGTEADLFVFNNKSGRDTLTDFVSGTDDLQFIQSTLKVGDGDALVEGALTRAAPGGFGATAELVIFTTNAASLTTTAAAATIGSATAAYAAGRTALFAIDNGTSSAVYLFTSSGADALVSAGELTLLATLTGTPSTAIGDYVFAA